MFTLVITLLLLSLQIFLINLRDIIIILDIIFFAGFGVWQNVHIFEIDNMGNLSSIARIRFHIQSWYDEVEDFDSAEFG